MNRNLRLSAAITLAASAGAGTASAQIIPFWNFDRAEECRDFTQTPPPSPYSDDYGQFADFTDLFGVNVGISGTVGYSKICFPPNGITLNAAGRIGFFIGTVGSVQDTAYGGTPDDDFLILNYGSPNGVGGNWGYGVMERMTPTGTVTRTPWAKDGIFEFFHGASDRYAVVGAFQDNIRAELRYDLIGDGVKFTWSFQNQGDDGSIGFDFGQWVFMENSKFIGSSEFVDVPGYRPITTDHRFTRTPNDPKQSYNGNLLLYGMPPYADFGMTRAHAYGLHVPTQPDASVPDQTPVDILDIGKIGVGWLLGSERGNDEPMPRYDSANPALLDDTDFLGATSFVQRWLPTPVNKGTKRTIFAYYKTTWGVSNFEKPYSAVIDTPKVVAVDSANPTTFLPNPMTVRVYLDNTRGFSAVDAPIPLNDVRVTLSLPEGMTDANDPTNTRVKITKIVNRVDPRTFQSVDFQVRVDPTTFGIKQYNVKIEPNPGAVKSITGSINVASQPYLQIRSAANLVTAPWQFASSSWNSILNSGSDPLVPDVDYQAYEWDAAQQGYVVQIGPRRGFGTWIVSKRDVGFKQLGGSPSTPPDLVTGADLVLLRPGWNLIANPYNYSIQIGQIVGVNSATPSDAQTFESLANSNLISSSLAWWDQNTQTYKFTTGFSELMIPNRGYWIYVSSSSNLTISYPPVNSAFIPVQPSEEPAYIKWNLKMSAQVGGVVDGDNAIGTAKDAGKAKRLSLEKPPVSPTKNALSAAFLQKIGNKAHNYARSYQSNTDHNEWTWQVYSRAAGTAKISWPTPKNVPADVDLTIIDLATNRSYDMRQVQTLNYVTPAESTHQFKIVADNGTVPPGPVLGSVAATRTGGGASAPYDVTYKLTASSNVSVKVLQGTKEIVTIKDARDSAGAQSILWNLTDASGKKVAKGSYSIVVSATAKGRSAETKTVYVFVY